MNFEGLLHAYERTKALNTKIIKITEKHMDSDSIEEAGRILREGGLVAFPTETVYGLGADGLQPEAAKKIYEAKGRPSDNPLIIHIADMESLEKIAEDIPATAYALAEKYWPGPLTMIFKKKEIVPMETTGGLNTVAVRFPQHKVAQALVKAGGGFIAAPSANTSGRPSPTFAEHVIQDMDGKIPMIIDGGPVGIGIESTIIDMTGQTPTILRPGFITSDMLEEIIGQVQDDPALFSVAATAKPKAPGMKYRHYAPKAPLFIVEGDQDDVVRTLTEEIEERQAEGKRVGLIISAETAAFQRNDVLYQDVMDIEDEYSGAEEFAFGADLVKYIGSRLDEEEIAGNLYQILREFDEEDVDVIYSESFDSDGFGQAIMNRLRKAAGNRVIIAGDV